MVSSTKTSEKRRFKRQQTNVDAVLAIGDSTSIQCIILDFCEQGLFLQLKNPSLIGLQKGNSTKIYFSAQTETEKEYFQIDGQIARIAEDGVGVVFDNISESMFNALKHSTNIGSISAHSSNPKFFLTSSNHDRFKKSLQDILSQHLPKLMAEFFEDVQDELEKPPSFAENFQDVVAQGNLLSVLRMSKDKLIADYCQTVVKNIDFTVSTAEKPSALNVSGKTLSLVEKHAFEESLSFSTLVRKLNTQYKKQLYQLELKLSYVTCFPRYLINNPIDPEHLCSVFRKEIASIDDSVAVKKSLYNAFLTTLTDHLSKLYSVFDEVLIEHGAPTETAEDIVWKKNYPTPTKPDTSFETHRPGDYFPSFDNDVYHYADGGDFQDTSLSGFHSQASRANYVQPVTQTASRLFNLINQSLTANQTDINALTHPSEVVTESHQSSGPVYSPDDLLSALIKLQTSRTLGQTPQNPTSLLQHQLEANESASGFLGEKAFSSEDKSKLDVYDQLFQALLNEVSLTPNVKSYLESIKLPLMALTLQDPTFLDSENHPARDLLNQLITLDSAVGQNKVVKNTQVRQVLDQLMERVAHSSITNPDIFNKANEELKEISGPIVKSKEANIRRVIEVYQGKEKLEKARQKIQYAINNRLKGKPVPKVIQDLLDSGWQHLLVISELNDDTENRLRYLESLDQLLNWYADINTIPQDQRHQIETELDFINSKLETVSTNAFFHNKVMQELRQTLIGVGSPPEKKSFITTLYEGKEVEPRKEKNIDRRHLEIDQFETGDWFTFSLQKEDFEPLKLVWIGELPEIFVFVNRDGYKKQELSRNNLAELLESGAVTQIENLDEPVMDRATTTMLQQMQEKLMHSVSHDPTTNLPNRKRFISLVKDHIHQYSQSNHVLGYLEIEDFRIITNVCGVAGGDQLLIQVADTINHSFKNGIIARLGDKTFGFLIHNANAGEGQEKTKQLRDTINKTSFQWNDKSYTISVTIGLVPILEGGIHNVEELLQKADTVNISAKRAGHNRIRMFEENDETLKLQTDIHEWAGRIDRIFAENRLFARCQMIAPINPDKNTHSHYEILLGVRDDDGKIIPPDSFIPAVERCQRMPEIDRWIVENVFAWIVDNRRYFDSIGGFAINLSGQSLNSEDFLNFLKDRLSLQDIPPEKITFEVTETVAAGSLVFTKRFIKEIKHFGCKFSLDDFGTGYSSYSYLKSLDVDYLKIDGSFIKDIANSPTDMVMVNSMNEIAHSLEMETIAEYVENMTIHAILKEIGVDFAQGWGIQKPILLADLTQSFL